MSERIGLLKFSHILSLGVYALNAMLAAVFGSMFKGRRLVHSMELNTRGGWVSITNWYWMAWFPIDICKESEWRRRACWGLF